MSAPAASPQPRLRAEIGVVGLWSLAVGLVISGEYFGWSYGWAAAGTVGFLYTTVIVAVLYVSFIFSFTELTTAIPHAGGPFEYARRAFGPFGGLVAGYATLVEFALAPPAIAAALGAYVHFQFESVPVLVVGIVAYVLFVGLNILGVKQAVRFELIVTVLAVAELVVFMLVVAPGFRVDNFLTDAMPSGFAGVLAAIPFAIWFFLAIEGVAMAAEEVRNPRYTIPRGYISGILTLVVLAFGVMILAGGAGDWHALSAIDYPLPEAMAMVVGRQSGWIHMLVAVGLFGLLASFHGIILSCSRQMFALARAGYLPKKLAALHATRSTPHRALVATGIFGVGALASGATSQLIILSALGAIAMYICSMLALFRLRRVEPDLERTFRAPLYPVLPLIALGLSVISFGVIAYFNPELTALFLAGFALTVLYYRATAAQRAAARDVIDG
ncbi:MAG TPA: ethanolamine permease [Burkholderiales bacterium]|nr:ethanolamine permease [Burkholderiales bacterium]